MTTPKPIATASATYAAQVGLPSKSGVGGGLLAVLPGSSPSAPGRRH
ncbi:glutaminase [Microbulbifer marinus]|nr:glutaminase [Microbulbifer marinus]